MSAEYLQLRGIAFTGPKTEASVDLNPGVSPELS